MKDEIRTNIPPGASWLRYPNFLKSIIEELALRRCNPHKEMMAWTSPTFAQAQKGLDELARLTSVEASLRIASDWDADRKTTSL